MAEIRLFLSEKKNRIAFLATMLFILLNGIFIYQEFFWFMLLPAVLLAIMLAVVSMDRLFFGIVILTPLSVNLERLEFGLGVALPTEPLIIGIMLVFLLRSMLENDYDRKIINHPISLLILLHLAWIFITTLSSSMPLVSVKFFISRLWFVTVFFYLAVKVLRNPARFRVFMWCYILPLTAVIIYTVINHALNGFAKEPAHWVMTPFYKDHTSYGAILALYLPVLLYLLMERYSNTIKFFTVFLLLIFLTGIVLSYTRAAWVSIMGAAFVFFVYYFRIRFSHLVLAGVSLVILLFSFRTEITMALEKNRQDSSDDLMEHVQSVSNISSDASNLERLNRWNSAIGMFLERPVFGWGPGTYAFQYAPFQHSQDLTIISTNVGDMGNAHSEYIGPLSEQGLPGALLVVLLLIFIYWYGTRVYLSLKYRSHRRGVLAVLLGLTTYFIHGMLNNFLDTDKASVPFWGFTALIVAMNLYYPKRSENTHAEEGNVIAEAS